ncbi:1,2-dihydroxy-3-keto-5-methylthiopentene dioxygenase [Marasmius crinis-equi]|uniref:1,2-dihydroxy-3-keto-5-methylthiopentene dioxygenase n=1 Tax=Marasmius crinis-equi TaxID=585013 RepID=A0ABR3FUZ1_9AGAR
MLAHYHQDLSADAASRPVSNETLKSLKFHLYPRQHSKAPSLEDKFKAISRELGFPWESELLRFDITSNEMIESMKEMVEYYTKDRVIEPYDILWMFTRGNASLDIEEPWTNSTIRLTVNEGESILIPAGAYHRYALSVNSGSDLRMWAMYKTSDRSYLEADLPPLIFGEEAEQHPARQAYLESIRP